MVKRAIQDSDREGAGRCGRHARRLAYAVAFAVSTLHAQSVLAQNQPRPAINVAAVIQAETATATALSIQISPANLIPRQAFVRIRGLPPTFALSEGHSIAVGAWAVPLAALPRLRLEVPTGSEGKSEITIVLVSIDGAVLDEAKSTLVVVRREQASAPLAPPTLAPPTPAPPAPPPPRVQPERAPVPLAKSPELAPGERDRAVKMLQRGNELIAAKDFSAAQHFYKRAAEMGLPEAAIALARTFDPAELARLGAVGLKADPEVARVWYEKARALGSVEADAFLLRLSAR